MRTIHSAEEAVSNEAMYAATAAAATQPLQLGDAMQ